METQNQSKTHYKKLMNPDYIHVGPDDEVWKDVVGYEGLYEVSDYGRVRNRCDRKTKRSELLQSVIENGYERITLTRGGIPSKKRVHRIVAEAFIPNPRGREHVNHKNGRKSDNKLSNLEWATRSENNQHAHDTGLVSRKGEKNSRSVLSAADVLSIRSLLSGGETLQTVIAKYPQVQPAAISKIKNNVSWKHLNP